MANFSDMTPDVVFHEQEARKAFDAGDFNAARQSFMKLVETIRQQNIDNHGQFEAELAAAKKAYSEFVAEDPLYQENLPPVLSQIKAAPGILQADLYKKLPEVPKHTLSYVIFFAADHGKIKRAKSGGTYALRLAGAL